MIRKQRKNTGNPPAPISPLQRQLNIAREHLDTWLEAELTLASSQSYTVGSRSLTRANLGEVRRQIQFWQDQIAKLENLLNRKGRNRVFRVVPRDL